MAEELNQLAQLAYALDTFYFLISGALVMWMAAGFTMLEAGLVRAKNTTEILTKNVALYAIACIMYMVIGYNIMYGGGVSSIIPSFSLILGAADNAAADIVAGSDAYYSNMSDFFFQVVFVATAMSIISGAVAERMKLWSFLLFAVVLTGIVYPVQGFWSWGGGFLSDLGYSDYAGSGIVHLFGAAAALAAVIVLGPRKGKYGANGEVKPIPGTNMPLATLGVFILWLGWFGFNGGSELKVSDVDSANAVALVFANTNLAAAGGVVAALITARLMFGKADLTMALNGGIAGLVSITAGPNIPSLLGATLIGVVGGVLVVLSIVALDKLKLDDPVGAISAHGTAGIWGVLAVPLWADGATFGAQFIGIATIFVWTFVVSLVLWMILKAIMGIRVTEEEEMMGLDITECGVEAYPEFTRTQ
ncbi:ammonium transporter [Spiribacter sp. C176]|uniref:Ammonium transporter n=1 Tax=Spiribacter salilacus TaxID=2664894 RepID=A0A6N7QQY5_9GAMM|nr:ammonium transporter [Spiribacter salilacus]MRH78100.1 ammonium transporter [Spiribacter salilacus]